MREKIANALAQARESENGRYAKLLVSDGPLRQTVVALRKGVQLQEHNAPPAASILVLEGKVTVNAKEEATMGAGDLYELTHYRHSVTAEEDAVFLLTTVTNVPGQESHSAEG